MSVYTCWYQGNLGYCTRRDKKWMFVPELGQSDSQIYHDLNLEDLVFANQYEQRFEALVDKEAGQHRIQNFLKSMLIKSASPRSVAGQLFTAQ